jgi:hypothetical protein
MVLFYIYMQSVVSDANCMDRLHYQPRSLHPPTDQPYAAPLTKVERGFLLMINSLKRQRCTECMFVAEDAGILDEVSIHLTPREKDWRRYYNCFSKMWFKEDWVCMENFLGQHFRLLTSERTGLQSEDIFNAIEWLRFKTGSS